MIFLILFSLAHAKEQWLCTSQSSELHGDQVYSCGVGQGKDEDQARAQAFKHAQDEFNRLCTGSHTCVAKNYSIEPKRTTCDQSGHTWTCYRLLVFVPSLRAKQVASHQEPLYHSDGTQLTPEEIEEGKRFRDQYRAMIQNLMRTN